MTSQMAPYRGISTRTELKHSFCTKSVSNDLDRLISVGQSNTKLRRRRLGKSDLHVTELSLGGVGIGGTEQNPIYGQVTDEEAIATVHTALEHGINLIDSSPLYRESERRIGLALQGLSDHGRERLIISTKVGDECPPFSDNGGHDAFSYQGVQNSVTHSLRQMGLNYIDLCLLHDPDLEELERFMAPPGPQTGGMEALRDFKKDGTVRSIGIGCVEREQQLRFVEGCHDVDVVLAVNDFNLVRRYAETELFPIARERDIGILNAGCFYMGLLAEPQTSWSEGFKVTFDKPELMDVALRMESWWEKRDIPLRVAALQFGLRHESVHSVPAGCRFAEEVEQLCDALAHPISEKEWSAFDQEFGSEVANLRRDSHWYYDKRNVTI